MEIAIDIIKTIVVIVGFSSALVNDALTFRFLKDFRITREEQKVLYKITFIVLISLLLITAFLATAVLYNIPEIETKILVTSGVLVLIIILNEMIWRRIVDKLTKFRIESTIMTVWKIIFLRRVAFCLSFVSFFAWIYLLYTMLFAT